MLVALGFKSTMEMVAGQPQLATAQSLPHCYPGSGPKLNDLRTRGPALALLLLLVLCLGGCISLTSMEISFEQVSELREVACENSRKSDSPWNMQALYSCESDAFYIPYQLWTGAAWRGDKQADCMHPAGILFNVNEVSATTIKGPEEWQNPLTGEHESIWVRDKVDSSKTQYFTCHDKGIGQVYDSRRQVSYRSGRCTFPAGFGWRLGVRRYCDDTSIEIISVKLDRKKNLEAIVFKWWHEDTLDHIYRYEVDKGMTNAWQQ